MGVGRGGGTSGQVAGCHEGLGERKKEKGAPKWEGTDCPNGRGAKGTSEEGGLGGRTGQCFLHQGTVLGGGSVPLPAHPWHLENQ